jgi:hypothetical protein
MTFGEDHSLQKLFLRPTWASVNPVMTQEMHVVRIRITTRYARAGLSVTVCNLSLFYAERKPEFRSETGEFSQINPGV